MTETVEPTRVGCVLSADNKQVRFLGYGVYEGDFARPGAEATVRNLLSMKFEGQALEDELQRWLHSPIYARPRIKLDSGKIVWGNECWWGPEEKIKAYLDGERQIIHVDIDAARKVAAMASERHVDQLERKVKRAAKKGRTV